MNDARAAISMDSSIASVARVYDYMLGGKDNFAVDRAFAESIVEQDPDLAVSVRYNKDFGRRVVDYMTSHGIRQFLDLGSGIPTSPPSVHDTARRTLPDARVVYVDHDPVVVAHNQALRAVGPGLAVIQADFLKPDAVFTHPDLLSNVDFSRPLGVLILSVFQNSTDTAVGEAMKAICSRLPPGSMIAVSHLSDRTSAGVRAQAHKAARTGQYPFTRFRSDGDIAAMLDGLDLVAPGVVDYRDWRPSEAEVDKRPELSTQFSAAVGVVPCAP